MWHIRGQLLSCGCAGLLWHVPNGEGQEGPQKGGFIHEIGKCARLYFNKVYVLRRLWANECIKYGVNP